MKKCLIIFCFLTIIVAGCRYKEGPLISFRSVEKRITGTWQITELTASGIDSLHFFIDSCGNKMIIGKMYYDDLNLKIGFGEGKIKFGGTIHFKKNKNEMQVFFGYPHFSVIGPFISDKSDWKIIKLTNNEFKVVIDFKNSNYHISFKKLSL